MLLFVNMSDGTFLFFGIDERIRYATEELMQMQLAREAGYQIDLPHIPPELKRTE